MLSRNFLPPLINTPRIVRQFDSSTFSLSLSLSLSLASRLFFVRPFILPFYPWSDIWRLSKKRKLYFLEVFWWLRAKRANRYSVDILMETDANSLRIGNWKRVVQISHGWAKVRVVCTMMFAAERSEWLILTNSLHDHNKINVQSALTRKKTQLKTSLIQQIYSRNIQTINFLC